MTLWHPHTEQPAEECLCLIALPGDPANAEEDPPMLIGALHVFTPGEGFADPLYGDPLVFPEYYWARDTDLLAGLQS